MAAYDTKLFDTASVQTCVSRSDRVYISEIVQSGLLSKTYDVGRYAPAVEIPAHHFHLLIAKGVNRYLAEEAAKA